MESKPDFCAFVPVVNRPDLLRNVVNAVKPLWPSFTVIDNSSDRWVEEELQHEADLPIVIYVPSVPLSFAQSMSLELKTTLKAGKPFCIHMHSDAIIPDGACGKLLDYARIINDYNEHNQRWGVIYTHYDVLAVYNPKAFEDIGGYDTNLPNYFSDNDWYRRLELAGWERINSGIEVGHLGSQTINSDAYLRHVTNVTFPLHREYYRQKWGGLPGEEKFTHPFGVLPREWALNTPLTAK